MVERISSGVKGIDRMIDGGIPKNSILAVTGPAGIGKSIMALQFVLDGAKNNEKSLYINLEEPRENIDRTIKNLNLTGFEKYEKKDLITVTCLDYEEFEKIYIELFKKIEKDKKIKRIVIDSFNCFFSYVKLERFSKTESYEIRKMLSQSFKLFRRKNATTLLVLENGSDHNSDLNHYVEYMVDGVIHMDFISLGSIERRVFVPKMRWTRQYDSSLVFDITKKGIVVKS